MSGLVLMGVFRADLPVMIGGGLFVILFPTVLDNPSGKDCCPL